jgi:hypothetical protein
MAREHPWIEEGIATYVEPIAGLQLGQIRTAKVWGDLVEGLPYGLPRPGDQGLDRYANVGPHILGRRDVLSDR